MTAVAALLPPWRLVAWSGVDVFWLLCFLNVLYAVWRGWRTGLFRQLSVVIGLVAGWLIGLTDGPAFFARFWSGTALPKSVSVPLASMILGLIVYVLAVVAGRLLFKRACDHSFGPTRLFLGGGGALVGLGLGLFGVWIFVVVVRLAGSIFAGPAETSSASGTPGSAPTWPHRQARTDGGAKWGPDFAAPVFVRIKRSVESGFSGELVRLTDPFPKEVYTDVSKAALIAATPALQEHLLDAPSLHDFALEPRIAALRQDASIAEAFQRGDYWRLLLNPRVRAAFHDPRVQRRLEKVDVTRVLNDTVP